MDIPDILRLITEFGLDEYRGFILGVARPTIEILAVGPAAHPGRSKFGGVPDLPAGAGWPRHARGPYRFLGQFDLSDAPTGPHGLPAAGVLSFFVDYDPSSGLDWTAEDCVRVFHFADTGGLRPGTPPEGVDSGPTCAVRFAAGVDVPDENWCAANAVDWPIEESDGDAYWEYGDAYWELRCRLHPSGRYLLGYPFNTTLAYDPTPGPEWRSLLTLGSDRELGWYWHDGDWLVTFVRDQAMRAGDFSMVKVDAG